MEQSSSPLHFPSSSEDGCCSFEELCYIAADTKRPLHLRQDIILKETITPRKRQVLHIQGDINNAQHPHCTISGDLHSLFLLNNQSQLILTNIHLNQTLETSDHRKVGACVNLRYKSRLCMTDGILTSLSGFCCWAVQKSCIQLKNCKLEATLRSPVVCFGQPTCSLHKCCIQNAGVHGICARGACNIELDSVKIIDSAARAVYAYANANVHMKHCTVSGTKRPDKAAVEISAADGSLSKICMENCRIFNNEGIGLLIRGEVECQVSEDCILEQNLGGDMIKTESLQDDTLPTSVMQRDASGSSFRQGDWYCPNCEPRKVVIGGNEECPACQSVLDNDCLLTIAEINQLNQGVVVMENDERPETLSIPRWEYDSDDRWLPYDDESNQQLEEAYQQRPKGKRIVLLQNAKYRVDIDNMEQVNVASQMMRLVRRVGGS